MTAPPLFARYFLLGADFLKWWESQTLLSPSVGDAGWSLAQRAFGVGPPIRPHRISDSSYVAALAAACAGHGVILAPIPFADEEFAAARLIAVSDVQIDSAGAYSLVMRDTLAASRRGRDLARRLSRLCAAPGRRRPERSARTAALAVTAGGGGDRPKSTE